jgi:adenylate cyclase
LPPFVLAAGWLYLGRQERDLPVAETGVPKIAVLAFDNMSGDPGFGYFSDGVSEDIISMLACSPDLSVVARNSSFAHNGKATDIRQIGKDLNVDYVLEGSVRKDADMVRIVAQLIDSKSGEHVWAERFDKAGADPWALQDEVTGKIISSLTGEIGQIKQAQYRDAWGKDVTKLGEYDYYLRGHDVFMNAPSKADNDKAKAIWRQGLAKFPGSGLLKIKLGWYHFQNVFNFWSNDVKHDVDRAVELAREGLEGDSVSPHVRRLGHFLLARALSAQGHKEAALREAETARQLAPYDAFMLGNVAATFVENGQPQKGLEWIEDAAKREPGQEAVYNYRRGWTYTVLGEEEKALASLKEAADWVDVPLLRAINLVRLDKVDEARAQVKAALEMRPDFTCATWASSYFYSDPKILDAEVADLKKAGLPPGPPGT